MTGCPRCGRPPESHPAAVGEDPRLIRDTDPSLDTQGSPRTPLRAVRTMRARTTKGTCPLCGATLAAGRQIGLVRGLGWCHASCVVTHNREISTEGERT